MNTNYKKGLLLFLFLLSGILAFSTLGESRLVDLIDYFNFVFLFSSTLGSLIASVAYVFLIRKFNDSRKKVRLIVFAYLASVIATYVSVPILLLSSIELEVVKIKETEGLFEIAFMSMGLIGVPIFMLIFSIVPFLLTIRGRHKRILKYVLLLTTTILFLIFVFNMVSATTCGFGKNRKCIEDKINDKIKKEGENFHGLIKYGDKIYHTSPAYKKYKLTLIDSIDVETFEQVEGSEYFKDKNNVYENFYSDTGPMKIIEGADPETFILLKNDPSNSKPAYAKDKTYIYCEGKKLNADYLSFETTFKITGKNTARDKNYNFYRCDQTSQQRLE